MNTKLTLRLDSIVINKAKKNLLTKDKSLSGMVQDYFKILIAAKNKQELNSPVVEELTGVAKPDKDIDEKRIVTDYLLEKYS